MTRSSLVLRDNRQSNARLTSRLLSLLPTRVRTVPQQPTSRTTNADDETLSVRTERFVRDAIVHGDALDLLPHLDQGAVDLYFTSPPYADQRAESRCRSGGPTVSGVC